MSMDPTAQRGGRRLVGNDGTVAARVAGTSSDAGFGAPLSVSGGAGVFVSSSAVRELLAHASAKKGRSAVPTDAQRRAAIAVAYAIGEVVISTFAASRGIAGVEVAEQRRDLVDRTGLIEREVGDALALLLDAGVVERVIGDDGARLRLTRRVEAELPVVRAIAGDALRSALRAIESSVMPSLCVVRAIAELTPGLERDGGGVVVACTQRELADATLLGRTAVVSALSALERIGALERAARRGTWTDCRLLPAAVGRAPLGGSSRTTPSEESERVGSGQGITVEHRVDGSAPIVPFTAQPAAPVDGIPMVPMVLDVGGVQVPIAPGMTVQPPPGARLVIEVDPDGRRYLRFSGSMRLGPLPD